jgi:hypothetical protein
MEDEKTQQILDAIAEEFEKYPFDSYSGLEVAEILRGNKKL